MLTNPLRILIVDDEPERAAGWAKDIRALLNVSETAVQSVAISDARKLIDEADCRRRNARKNGTNPFDGQSICDLDTVDILIVDYDLQELLVVGQWSTGLQVVNLARAFTKVKLIVLVNQFGSNAFDLTLTKMSKSYADVDVGSDQLLNPALWNRSQIDGYAPWAWNDGLRQASIRMEAMVEWTIQHLDKPVLESLGFTTDVSNSESETHLAKDLWQECVSDPGQSFRDLVRGSEFLTPKDREDAIVSFDMPCARVAAALISHWLDRCVIPANEVLIDLPHLVSTYPWLLTKREDIQCWQASASLENGYAALITGVQTHAYRPGFQLSRPVVWRHKVLHDATLAEPSGFTYDGFPDVVFCEDTSRFHEFANARPFTCRLPGGDTQRFTANPEKVQPTMGGVPLTDVLYEPSVLFAL